MEPPTHTPLLYPQLLPSAAILKSTLIPSQLSGAWTAGTKHCPALSPPYLVRSSQRLGTRPEDFSCWSEVQPRSLLSPQRVYRQVSDVTLFRPTNSHASRSCLRALSQGEWRDEGPGRPQKLSSQRGDFLGPRARQPGPRAVESDREGERWPPQSLESKGWCQHDGSKQAATTTCGPCSSSVPVPESQRGQGAGQRPPRAPPRPSPASSPGPAPARPCFSLTPGAPEKGGQPETEGPAGCSQAPRGGEGPAAPAPRPLPVPFLSAAVC